MGRGVGAPALAEGEIHLGSALVGIRAVGALLQVRDRCLVSPRHPPRLEGFSRALLGWPSPAFLPMPPVAPEVSSVLEGSMLFLALNQGLCRQSQG